MELHKMKSRVRWGTHLDQVRQMAGLHFTLFEGKGGAGNCNDLKNMCRHNLENREGDGEAENREEGDVGIV
jgi:hypothetical protein